MVDLNEYIKVPTLLGVGKSSWRSGCLQHTSEFSKTLWTILRWNQVKVREWAFEHQAMNERDSWNSFIESIIDQQSTFVRCSSIFRRELFAITRHSKMANWDYWVTNKTGCRIQSTRFDWTSKCIWQADVVTRWMLTVYQCASRRNDWFHTIWARNFMIYCQIASKWTETAHLHLHIQHPVPV